MSRKGPSYERSVCRTLSLWWSDGERNDLFWRTAASGGMATVRKQQTESGDIRATCVEGDELLKVVALEIKKGYPKVNLHDLIDAPEGLKEHRFITWIKQAKASAELSGAPYWWLIWKRDRRESMLYVPLEFLGALRQFSSPWSVENYVTPFTTLTVLCDGRLEALCGMPLSKFLEAVTPERVTNCLPPKK